MCSLLTELVLSKPIVDTETDYDYYSALASVYGITRRHAKKLFWTVRSYGIPLNQRRGMTTATGIYGTIYGRMSRNPRTPPEGIETPSPTKHTSTLLR